MGFLLRNTTFRVEIYTPQKAGREAFAVSICFFIALLFCFFSVDVSRGVLPDFISNTGIFGHRGFVCPLCGGTRAFVLVSAASVSEALHYSLLGTCISIWLLLTLPIRFFYRFSPTGHFIKESYFLIKKIESPDHLIIAMGLFIWLQLGLHYLWNFTWIPLEQLSLPY